MEKEEDLNYTDRFNLLKAKLNQHSIKWHPVIYKRGARNYLLNFTKFIRLAFQIVKRNNINLLHCRSYLPAYTGFLIKKFLGVKYIFDTRGFWFDEKADVKGWNKKGVFFKTIKLFEKKLFLNAASIVMLSENGKRVIQNDELFTNGSSLKNIFVIPTCADLNHFKLKQKNYPVKLPTIGYVGTATGWYDFDKTTKLLAYLNKFFKFKIAVFNKGEHEFIKTKFKSYAIPEDIFSIESVSFEDMPARLNEIDISIFFIYPFFSKRASAATKLGELLASGIPVITNNNVGDHEYYISNYKTGAIVDTNKMQDYDFNKIFQDLMNSATAIRCRKVSERYFSLETGVNDYKRIYDLLLNQEPVV